MLSVVHFAVMSHREHKAERELTYVGDIFYIILLLFYFATKSDAHLDVFQQRVRYNNKGYGVADCMHEIQYECVPEFVCVRQQEGERAHHAVILNKCTQCTIQIPTRWR